ncbi:MAG: DEAD/DEAH box helicase [Treponema sp.]|nr:DEAD/DEAH box helicase [Treponema sp.]
MLPQTFHPIIRKWFTETYGNPTSVQAEAWPLIESGENVLAIAPTGSGKTLTAFLSAISRFCCTGGYEAEKLSVLYISPLKALNEDIKRNLLEPLAAIKACFLKEGADFPPIHVETRSGDTPQSQRRRFFIRPPSILALTPESLSILLLNPKSRRILSGVKYLIIDEIHAVLGNKRGAFLSCQTERLVSIAGDFQRISLSATVRNPETAAEFTGRNVRIVSPPAEKKIEFTVEFPEIEITAGRPACDQGAPMMPGDFSSRYTPLINYILSRIWEGATLLVFAESRRRAEKLSYFLNQSAASSFSRNAGDARVFDGPIAFPHHGSLSKEIRRSVEKGFSEGKIPCVVATASLELGLDIGYVDEVVLAGSPANVSQALQRIGRSGHGVGETSRGKLFAFHGKDLLIAAALKEAVEERDIEEIKPIENPLDILAQIILSLCAEKERDTDKLYELIKKFYIFRSLNYESYYRTVLMLAGLAQKGDNTTRLRDVKPRIWYDKIEGKIGVMDGTVSLLYTSGGVIANRGLYSLRLADGTKIGELDEEFVWERSLGDCFDFGAQGWRVTKITSESVEVSPLDNRADFIPFWKGDLPFRSVNLTGKLLSLLEYYNKTSTVKTNLSGSAHEALRSFLDLQSSMQNKQPLPDKNNIAVEIIAGNELNRDFITIVFHSFRGGQINYPLSLALSAQMSEMIGLRIENFTSDDNILFLLPRLGMDEASFKPQEIFRRALASLDKTEAGGLTRGERLFRNRLESSARFGAAFREAAERSLLLPKAPFGKRTPLWIMRQRSKRLFDSVASEDGFPATAEAWRTCLVDTFDMEGFRQTITDLNSGTITLSFFMNNNPSPFSKDIVREETNAFTYEYDERRDLAAKNHSATLSDKAIDEAVRNSSLRPALKISVINDFTSKLRREIHGWAPDDDLSLNEWIKERTAIPADEWKNLCAFMPQSVIDSIDTEKIKIISRNKEGASCVVHREWEENWKNEPLSLLGQWLRYEGPVSVQRICEVFSVTETQAQDAVNALVEVDEAVNDVLVAEDDGQSSSLLICDRENLEMLLRISRKKNRPVVKERPASLLVPFLALRQGLINQNHDAFFNKSLYAWTAPVKFWETEILCARNAEYTADGIDKEIREGNLLWFGTGVEKIGFCSPDDLDLSACTDRQESILSLLLKSSFFNQPRDYWEIKNEIEKNTGTNINSRNCAEAIWQEAWQGALTSDSLDPVRRGIEYGFIPKAIDMIPDSESMRLFGRHKRIPSALKNRWKSGAPVHGMWYSLLMEEETISDPIEEDIINRDRVRLLLSRWGILCRHFLENESPQFSWSKLLPVMRRMELAGELAAGRFFSGINSLQFASPSIISDLEQAEKADALFWMNASDPASPAGLDIEGLGYPLCSRSANNRLYFRGSDLIAISTKNGKDLKIFIDVNEPDTQKLITLFKIPRTRKILPLKKLSVETINDQTAALGPYASAFINAGFTNDRGKLVLW